MSSKMGKLSALEAWLLFVGSAILFVWYANPQILYTLIFPYQVFEFLFPGLLPDPSSFSR